MKKNSTDIMDIQQIIKRIAVLMLGLFFCDPRAHVELHQQECV